jgi:hypothetical protein
VSLDPSYRCSVFTSPRRVWVQMVSGHQMGRLGCKEELHYKMSAWRSRRDRIPLPSICANTIFYLRCSIPVSVHHITTVKLKTHGNKAIIQRLISDYERRLNLKTFFPSTFNTASTIKIRIKIGEVIYAKVVLHQYIRWSLGTWYCSVSKSMIQVRAYLPTCRERELIYF